MENIADKLLARSDISLCSPAPPEEIELITKRFQTRFPDALVNIWRCSNGVVFPSIDARLYGPAEAIEFIDENDWFIGLDKLGYFPVLCDNNSNFMVMNFKAPMAFRIFYMPHDSGIELHYRSIETFLEDLLNLLNEKDNLACLYFPAKEGDYPPNSLRTLEDQNCAKTLLTTNGKHDEWNIAVTLLDASNLEQFAALLETDHFVRRDVRERMRKMTNVEIQKLYREDQEKFDSFAQLLAAAARDAGFNIGKRDGDALKIGKCWLNLEGFFYRRNARDAMKRIIWWIEDLDAGRNPHHRSDNLLID